MLPPPPTDQDKMGSTALSTLLKGGREPELGSGSSLWRVVTVAEAGGDSDVSGIEGKGPGNAGAG
jgi:hypothetical protein